MKHLIILLAITFSAGCAERLDKAEFNIISEEKNIFLSYKSASPFSITLTADDDSRVFPHLHPAGEGRIRIFLDKGAVWLSEHPYGYGMLAPIATPVFLSLEEMKNAGSNVFPVAEFKPDGTPLRKIYLSISQPSG